MTPNPFQDQVDQIKENLHQVKTQIDRAANKSGRKGDDIRLIAVTKLLPLEMIKAGIEAGLREFGENYPEQAADKIRALESDPSLTWHMIGHIQSRKTSIVCAYFDWVHTIDRMKIAHYLDRYSREANRVMPVLIEVNVSGEESKHGWNAWEEDRWQDLIADFEKITQFPQIEVCGLMTMPPYFDDPELTRPYYQRLSRLQSFLRENLPNTSWDQLSIGTSFDFEVAIEEGATMVRLGTSIFGPRPT